MKKDRLLTIDKYTKDRINANILDDAGPLYGSLNYTWDWNNNGLKDEDFFSGPKMNTTTTNYSDGNGPMRAPEQATLPSWTDKGYTPYLNGTQTGQDEHKLKGTEVDLSSGGKGDMMSTITSGIHSIGTSVKKFSEGLSKMKSSREIFTDIGGYNNTANMYKCGGNLYDAGGWMSLAGDSVNHITTAISDINKPKETYKNLETNVLGNVKTGVAATSTDLLISSYLSYNPMQSVNLKDMWQGWGATAGKALGQGLEGSASGLKAGGAIGAIIGGVMGTATGILGGALQRKKAKKYTEKINNLISAANNRNLNILDTKAHTLALNTMNKNLKALSAYGGPIHGALEYDLANTELRNLELKANSNVKLTSLPNSWANYDQLLYPLNSYDFGGDLQTLGADFSTGYSYVANGGTHEENPNMGVPMGYDQSGTANLVEEGEVIWNDYVFSRRLTVPKKDRKALGLNGKKKMTYADAAQSLVKESDERPNDPISKLGFDSVFNRLKESQELVREIKKLKELAQQLLEQEAIALAAQEEFNQLPPDQLQAIQQLMIQQQIALQQTMPEQISQEEMAARELAQLGNYQHACGGKLYDNAGDLNSTTNGTAVPYYSATMLNISPEVWNKLTDEQKIKLSDLWDDEADVRATLNPNYTYDGITQLLNSRDHDLKELTILSKGKPITLNDPRMKEAQITDPLSGNVTGGFGGFNGLELPYIANSQGLYPIDANSPIWLDDYGNYHQFNGSPSSYAEVERAIEDSPYPSRIDNSYDKSLFTPYSTSPILNYLSDHYVREPFEVTPFKEINGNPENTEPEPKETKTKKEKEKKNIDLSFDPSWLRYAPAFDSGVLMLTDALGLTNKFKGTRGKAIRQSASALRDRETEHLGDLMAYNPQSKWEAVNNLNAQYAAQRAALDNMGNRVSSATAKLQNNHNQSKDLGTMLAQIDENNFEKLFKITQANNAIKQNWMEAEAKDNALNAELDAKRADIYMKAADADDEETTALSTAKNTNRANFYNNLGEIGREETMKNWLRDNPNLYYALNNSGMYYKGRDSSLYGANGGYLTIKKKNKRRK